MRVIGLDPVSFDLAASLLRRRRPHFGQQIAIPAQAGIGANPAPGPPLALTSLRTALNKVRKLSGVWP
jgi:hypothetical protein